MAKYLRITETLRFDRYPDFSEIVYAVDRFRQLDNPEVCVEDDGWGGGDCCCGIVFTGNRLENDDERKARLDKEKKRREKAKQDEVAAAEKEKETLRKLLEKYPEEAHG